jgi:hypothetical protein
MAARHEEVLPIAKTILLMQREEFPSTNLKERHPYGGISWCKYNASRRKM